MWLGEGLQKGDCVKVLVTGATGLLGSHIVERSVAQGHEVRALARKTSDVGHLRLTGVETVFGDVEHRNSLPPALKGIEVVFHAAGRVTPGWGSWQQFETTIVRGTENLLWASANAGVSRFLQVSSSDVYGEASCRGIPADESTPCQIAFTPHKYYACAKLQAEKLVFDCQRKERIRASAIRPGWIYGPRDRLLCDRIARQLEMPIVVWPGKANPRIPLVFASDVADCAIMVATSDRTVGQCYNVGPPYEVRLRDFAAAMARALGRPEPKVFVPYGLAYAASAVAEALSRLRRAKDMPYLTRSSLLHLKTEILLDVSRVRKEVGWEPKVSLNEGVRLYAEWRRRQETG
jgi:nucleoside-diphosphate-sugar epimerase